MFNKIIISVFYTTLLTACTINPYTTSADFTYHSDCCTQAYALSFNPQQHHIQSKPQTQKTVIVSNITLNNNVNTRYKKNTNIHYANKRVKNSHHPKKHPQGIRIARNDLRRNITPINFPSTITHKTTYTESSHSYDNRDKSKAS